MGQGKLKRWLFTMGLGMAAASFATAASDIIPGVDKPDVYMIPGLGTDWRVFRDFNLEYGNLRFIQWADPGNIRSLEEYASLLAGQIDTSRNFVIVGVSFGGMLGVEISRDLNNSNLILISSARNRKELPLTYRTARILPLHHLLGQQMLQNISGQKFIYRDVQEAEDRHLYRQMLVENGAELLKRQMDMVIQWKNNESDPDILQIHGTADRVLPARKIENAVFIEGGTHKMVVNHARTLCEIIDNYLLELMSNDSARPGQAGRADVSGGT
jgi:pimeloyl-ACP methyl ester carboxylesterase